jgi:DNA-binding transcriptional regulator WhiA
MQTFSEEIKEELAHYEYENDAMKAILSSFFSNNLVIAFNNNVET